MNSSRQALFDQIVTFEKTMIRLKRHILAQVDITPSQAELLMAANETSRVASIAETLQVSSSAATQLIESAEAKGLLIRHRSEADKRAVDVALTAKGRSTLENLSCIKGDLAKELLQELTDAEVEQLTTIYKKITQHAVEKHKQRHSSLHHE